MAPVSDTVIEYCVRLAKATRPHDPVATETVKKYLKWGAGPRATQFLIHAARVKTILDNRFNVSRDDINYVSYNILAHRIIMNFNAEAEGVSSNDIIDKIIACLKNKNK